MKRKPGFYWVLASSGWIVAEYSVTGIWHTTDEYGNRYHDSDFEEINETIINPPTSAMWAYNYDKDGKNKQI